MRFPKIANIGLWYAPAYDKVNGIPIKPAIHFVAEDSDAGSNLSNRLLSLIVFESLREQVAEGKGVSCLFHDQKRGGCCGDAELLWGIYEAGLKAMKEAGWQPTQWVEPECDKPNKE